MSDLEARIEALETRLRLAEDRLEILDLEGRYVKTYDSRDGQAWASLFTTDGVYMSRGSTSDNGMYVQGREQLAAFCTDAPFNGMHLITLPEIVITGDEAVGRLHFQFFSNSDQGQPAKSLVAYYDAHYRRVDGRWLLQQRVTTPYKRTEVTDGPYPQGSGLTK